MMRPCLDCGRLSSGSRCEAHARLHSAAVERQRPSTTARGYGSEHQATRRAWADEIEGGIVSCARCGRRIFPDTPWDLGHSEDRRMTAPEHARCNRAAAGRAKSRVFLEAARGAARKTRDFARPAAALLQRACSGAVIRRSSLCPRSHASLGKMRRWQRAHDTMPYSISSAHALRVA